MTCNIQFVFVKRWSIFCNYRTVFELQQYPWVLIIVVSHQNLEIISIFTWAKSELGELEPILTYLVKESFGDKLLSSKELDTSEIFLKYFESL